MKTLLQQHRYALGMTLRRFLAQPFSWLSNLLVIALALSIPLLGASVLQSVQPVAREVSIQPELTLFLKIDITPAERAGLADRIKTEHADLIESVRVVPRETALAELRAHPAWSNALAALPDNPLPDAIVATLHDADDLAAQADLLARQWGQWPGVERVQLDSAWVQRLEALLRFGRIGLGLLALGVALVVLATVFNTVRMQALSQREEISVARLLGATESFVRRPFLYQGALTCTLAALMAIMLSALALRPLNRALFDLARSYDAEFILRLPPAGWLLTAILAIALLGALSARWSVTRSTRF